MKQVKKQLGQIKEPRNSSLEILRIICIVLVVTFHCFIWMGWKHNDFAIANTSWVWCVLCLMMITGYFSINKKNRILKVIILFLLFYILLIIEGLIVFSSLKENFAMTEWTPWTKEVVDIPANHFWWSTIFSINFPIPGLGLPENEAAGQFWYMITYIITIFFIPFINMGLKNLNKWFSLSLVVGILCMVNVFQQSGTWTMVILFSGMYAIGGWLRLYLVNINKQMCITCFVIIVSIVLVRNLTVAFGYEKDIHYTDDTLHGYDSVYMMMFYYQWSVVMELMSVAIFILFLKLKPKYNRVTNFIAQSSQLVYVIHLYIIGLLVWCLFANPNYQSIYMYSQTAKSFCTLAIALASSFGIALLLNWPFIWLKNKTDSFADFISSKAILLFKK